MRLSIQSLSLLGSLLFMAGCSDLSVKTPDERAALLSSSGISSGNGSSSLENTSSSQSLSSSSATACPTNLTSAQFCDPRDGQVYSKVKIGNQTWMAENIRFKPAVGRTVCYQGTKIVPCQDSLSHVYDANAAMASCPSGWVLPSIMEWQGLFDYLASQGDSSSGDVLKSKLVWDASSRGNDKYGMNILPTLFVFQDSILADDIEADFWTRTLGVDDGYSWMLTFWPDSDPSINDYDSTRYYVGARCLQKAASAIVSCPVLSGSGFCDTRDGQEYPTAKMGATTWMGANLNYEANSGSWCYDNDPANCQQYGRLYTWAAANAGAGACPAGWHVPSRVQLDSLAIDVSWDTTLAGQSLKADDALLWHVNTGNGDYYFNFLPGGVRGSDGTYSGEGDSALFWTNEDGYYRIARGVADDFPEENSLSAGSAISLRCVKD